MVFLFTGSGDSEGAPFLRDLTVRNDEHGTVLNVLYRGGPEVKQVKRFSHPRSLITVFLNVNARPSSRSGLAALTALLTFGFAFEASAQSVTTTPVGAVSKTVSVGLNDLGITLANSAINIGSYVSNTSNQIVASGMAAGIAQITPGSSYYIEVTDGTLEGDRFEIDVTATLASAGAALVINTNSGNNTVVLSSGDLAGSKFAIRKHITLAQLGSLFSPALVANNNPDVADQVWLFDKALSSFVSYYLRTDGVTWRAVGSSTPAGETVIPPGAGLIVKKRSVSSVITFIGEVRTCDFVAKLPAGLSFHASAYPITRSLATLGGTAANHWTGNNNPDSADQVLVFDAGLQTFVNYYLRADGVTWRRVGLSSPEQDTQLLSFNSSYIISRKIADDGYVFVAPSIP